METEAWVANDTYALLDTLVPPALSRPDYVDRGRAFGGAFLARTRNDREVRVIAWLDDECGDWGAYLVDPDPGCDGWRWGKAETQIVAWRAADPEDVALHAEFLARVLASEGAQLVRCDV